MAYTCNIITYVFLKDNLCPDTSKEGHYALEIITEDEEPLVIEDKAYTNPIFSIEGDGLNIYKGGIYKPDQKMLICKMAFSVNSVDGIVNDETGWLKENGFEYSVSNAGENIDIYTTTTSKYFEYNVNNSNCFIAVSEMCSALGYETLANIVDAAESYLDYTAVPMFEKYHTSWSFEELRI